MEATQIRGGAEEIVEVKFLSVCSAPEAVQWLKQKREELGDKPWIMWRNYENQERALVLRNDPYLDFGLARYGTCIEVAKEVYGRGDLGIRCTLLAHFPGGGISLISLDSFELADEAPKAIDELKALASNSSLDNHLFEQLFERDGLFKHLSDEDYQIILFEVSNNPRLSTPYDDTYLDGYADYSYNKVFDAAWRLTETVPVTERWAYVLQYLLGRCLPPRSFDPQSALSRWHLSEKAEHEKYGSDYFVRSRLADLLEVSDSLLSADDVALRDSFYRRFNPEKYPDWADFAEADGEIFLEGAIRNENLWQTPDLRAALHRLCWDHPDPTSSADMPNLYRGIEQVIRSKHPDWFNDDE
jgi:hypothetical protein